MDQVGKTEISHLMLFSLYLIFVSDCCAFSFETSTKRAKGAVVDIICATKALEKKHLFFSKSYLFLFSFALEQVARPCAASTNDRIVLGCDLRISALRRPHISLVKNGSMKVKENAHTAIQIFFLTWIK
jgi:hypothetical protein